MKKYDTNMKNKLPEVKEPVPSGVACTENKCKGEMMILKPYQSHLQYPKLKRAICNKCGWRGWV